MNGECHDLLCRSLYQHAKLTTMFTRIGIVLIGLLASHLAGCLVTEGGSAHLDQELIPAVIIGSAESPDPILERIKELEREGKVKDVIVMESFPVQIRMAAPQYIIDELNAMERKRLPGLE